MQNSLTQLPTDIWIAATWDEYIALIENPDCEKARGYYDHGRMLVETMPIGYDHSCDNTIIIFAINLFCTLKSIPINGLIGCSFRQAGLKECQPNISYYIGEGVQAIPRGTKIVDLNQYPPPSLAIEIADTTLSSDLGNKRLLYEEIEVAEYWVVDVEGIDIKAFSVAGFGSRRISESVVFPGLTMEVLVEALRRSREQDQSQIGAWLLQQFQR